MFNNPGTKLKVLAYFIFGLYVAIGIIYGLVSVVHEHILFGILSIAVGIIGGWLSSIVIYTIGDIAETVDTIAYRVSTPEKKPEIDATPIYSLSPSAPSSKGAICPNCGAEVNGRECDKCGYRL